MLSWMLLGVAAVAAAQAPSRPGVALVLEVSGGRIPGIEPYREIAADTTVTVPAGVRFVVQHYASCRRFVFTGGGATFRANDVDLSGAARPVETRVPCPRKITLKDDGASAAVVMRSIRPPPIMISSRPEFVIIGLRAAEFAGLRVRRGNDIVLEQRFASGQSVRWPHDAAPLAEETSYQLELLPLSANRAPIAIGLCTAGAAAASEALTLISTE